ncbi:MAG: DUF3313 domain-containing protein [Gammaproteobacteria bacterium]|nr:DUF3313 domain-containing protein [Gammaproteobacteria bacterium]MDH5302968.1 DUF3313 domain-containing protein [Gammaproteobacteria bacterium]MDH5321285.1 DUF3313 domain-containing protein [Gammaproteobacteria bacterium]
MHTLNQSTILRTAALCLGAIALAGCTTSNPSIDTGPDAEATFDGLYPVKGGRMDKAWARPDFSLEPYSKVMLQGVGIEYRPGGETGRTYYATSTGRHFEMSDKQKAAFQQVMSEAFVAELAKGEHFEIVTESGPDVLLIRGALLDVVSYVPPEQPGNSEIFLSRVGEATLVLEIRDSQTEAILLRAIDRRAAESSAMNFTNSNRVTNTAEARRLAQAWARILREGLDRFMAANDEAGE